VREVRLLEWLRLTRRAEPSAQQAKQRLQVLIAHERTGGNTPDFLPLLQKELLEVIRKYVEIDQEKVQVDFERGDRYSTLEVNVELPARLPRGQLV
jgi:cell division topological specificity factor